jgi:hypothetical protein
MESCKELNGGNDGCRLSEIGSDPLTHGAGLRGNWADLIDLVGNGEEISWLLYSIWQCSQLSANSRNGC